MDTTIKDRLLHNQCLKCDYEQMCTQIASEAEDFLISHMFFFLVQIYVVPSKTTNTIVKSMPFGKNILLDQNHDAKEKKIPIETLVLA